MQPMQAAPVPPTQQRVEEYGDYAAPRPRPAVQPSQQTMDRLRAAVMKQPEHAPAPRAPQPVQHQPQPQPQAGRSRLGGLGTLIHRMAGSADHQGGQANAAGHARVQPPVQAYDDEPQARASQDRIEIPAFLRRQAN